MNSSKFILVNGWMHGWMDSCMDAWMDGWIAAWMHGWMDRWMDGWIGRTFFPSQLAAMEYKNVIHKAADVSFPYWQYC
jgi:hypothetical protein